nr:MAG TPA: hypothetical protein [Caudoviricetes sp.]
MFGLIQRIRELALPGIGVFQLLVRCFQRALVLRDGFLLQEESCACVSLTDFSKLSTPEAARLNSLSASCICLLMDVRLREKLSPSSESDTTRSRRTSLIWSLSFLESEYKRIIFRI